MTECKYCKKSPNGVMRNLGSNKIFDRFYIMELRKTYRIIVLLKSNDDDDDIFGMTKPINYCPMCGRELGD